MNRKPVPLLTSVKYAAVVIAVLNLIALFGFQYNIPGLHLPSLPKLHLPKSSASAASNDAGFSIEFDTDTLTYDGTGSLDLLSGVTLLSNGSPVEKGVISADIKAGDSQSEKIIEYTADTDTGTITASRPLSLTGYNGPLIQLPAELPAVDNAESALDTITGLEGFVAKDGFGNDVSSDVTADYTMDEENRFLAHFTFTVSNALNDSATVKADVNLTPKPVVTLNADTVTIAKGERFTPLKYLQSAVGADGSNLDTQVSVENPVDRFTPGTYTVSYIIHAPGGITSDPAELTVIVTE